MSICSRCGRNVPQDSAFCDGCGAPVGPSPASWSTGAVAGSSPECDLRLTSPVISARHALFEILPDGMLRVTDLGSTNGTWVNGTRIHSAVVGRGDVVSLASHTVDLAAAAGACDRKAGNSPVRRKAEPAPPRPQRREATPEPAPAPVLRTPGKDLRAGGHRQPPSRRELPREEAEPTHGRGPMPGKERNPLLVILLSILTLGLYMFYWFWMTLDEIRVWRQGQGWGGAMVLILFVPVVNFIFLAVYFLIPGYIWDLYSRNGLQSPVSGPFGLIVFLPGLLMPLGGIALFVSGAFWNPAAWVLLALIPGICGLIWLVRVQNALNEFWRMNGAGP